MQSITVRELCHAIYALENDIRSIETLASDKSNIRFFHMQEEIHKTICKLTDALYERDGLIEITGRGE